MAKKLKCIFKYASNERRRGVTWVRNFAWCVISQVCAYFTENGAFSKALYGQPVLQTVFSIEKYNSNE